MELLQTPPEETACLQSSSCETKGCRICTSIGDPNIDVYMLLPWEQQVDLCHLLMFADLRVHLSELFMTQENKITVKLLLPFLKSMFLRAGEIL